MYSDTGVCAGVRAGVRAVRTSQIRVGAAAAATVACSATEDAVAALPVAHWTRSSLATFKLAT